MDDTKRIISKSILTATADAIRVKDGTSATITPSDFATKIAAIPTGKPEEVANVTPAKVAQTINPTSGSVFSKVKVSAVTSSIDNNIKASNIKKDVTILGVTGTVEQGEVISNMTYDGIINVKTNGTASTTYWTLLGSEDETVKIPVKNVYCVSSYYGFQPMEDGEYTLYIPNTSVIAAKIIIKIINNIRYIVLKEWVTNYLTLTFTSGSTNNFIAFDIDWTNAKTFHTHSGWSGILVGRNFGGWQSTNKTLTQITENGNTGFYTTAQKEASELLFTLNLASVETNNILMIPMDNSIIYKEYYNYSN